MKTLLKNRNGQSGINMVDLMMWLVIASLMLATAIQAITYYQQAAYAYHAKSDLAGAHSWVVASTSLNSQIPTPDDFKASLASGDLKLTSAAGRTNIGLMASSNQKYCIGIMSPNISDLTRNVFYSTSDDPSNVMRGTSIPASCGTPVAFAPVGVDTSSAVSPSSAPVVVGSASTPTKADFTWNAVPGASEFKVEQKINAGSWSVVVANQPGTTISVTANETDVVSVRVTAINNVGESPVSNIATVTLPQSSPSAYAAFGMNTNTQLNIGNAVSTSTAASVTGSGLLTGLKIDYIRSGNGFSCALAQGNVYCWGYGLNGQIGNGVTSSVTTPTKISMTAIGSRTITALSVGDSHSCVIASGEVFCWGNNASGKLGVGTSSGTYSSPTVASGDIAGKTVTSIETSANTTCALVSGKAYCWGDNTYSEVKSGAGTTVNSPLAVDDTGALSGVTVTKVAPGGDHTCLLGAGKVYCWGTDTGPGAITYGTASPALFDTTGLMSGKTVTVLGSGSLHSCALADSNVYCWGGNLRSQIGDASGSQTSTVAVVDPYGVFDRRTVTALSVGGDSACAIASGKVYCWGSNGSGQLGEGTTNNRDNPTPVITAMPSALNGKTAMTLNVGTAGVFVGYNNTPIADPAPLFSSAPSFTTASWGDDAYGKIGDGATTSALNPVSSLNLGALAGKKVSAVDPGLDQTCAIADGEIYCWGYNGQGQLGNRSNSNSLPPVKVFSDGWLRGRVVTDITVGTDYACALADGKAYCWGMDNFGQTGNSATNFRYNAPVPVGGVLASKTVTKIEAGNLSTCAVSEGKAYCWGINNEGEVGNGDTTGTSAKFPVPVDTTGVLNGKTVTAVAAGTHSTCAIADGKPYCWGSNQQSQLGTSTSQTVSYSPVAVNASGLLSGKTATYIGVGTYTACTLTSDGNVYCWGLGSRGELGTGQSEFTQINPSATALSGKTITTLGVGDSSACALDNTGVVYCWGVGGSGVLGNGSTANTNTPLPVTTTGVLSGVPVSKLWAGRNNAYVGY